MEKEKERTYPRTNQETRRRDSRMDLGRIDLKLLIKFIILFNTKLFYLQCLLTNKTKEMIML